MLPIRVSNRCSLVNLKGSLEIESPINPGMIHIGYGNVGIFDRKRERSVLNIRGKIIFKGKCFLGTGIRLNIADSGILTFGHNVNITACSAIDCQREISFGDDCLISWENLFIDGDHHNIFDSDGKLINAPQNISIGRHVWIGTRCLILKGTSVPENCIVAAGSLLNKAYTISNSIIAGSPAKAIKENISWQI
jgi:acetyltransferase-like isoleucine patch superfamily enzyme